MFIELLKELVFRQIEIVFINGKINFSGPKENIDEDLLTRLKENKAKLIKHFWPLKNSNFIPITTEGSKIPFIMIHGEMSDYYLSSVFGEERPLYSFMHVGANGEHIYLKSVDDYVCDYLKKLKTVLPEGPYLIGGYSFGGVLAFEIGCRLQMEGKDVPFLVLFDNIPPNFKKLELDREAVLFQGNFYNFIIGKIVIYYKKIYYTLRRKLRSIGTLLSFKFGPKMRKLIILDNYYGMMRKYKPVNKFKGKIIIFRVTENPFPIEVYNQWLNFCDEIEIIPIKGDHETFLVYPDSIEQLKDTIKERVTRLGI